MQCPTRVQERRDYGVAPNEFVFNLVTSWTLGLTILETTVHRDLHLTQPIPKRSSVPVESICPIRDFVEEALGPALGYESRV